VKSDGITREKSDAFDLLSHCKHPVFELISENAFYFDYESFRVLIWTCQNTPNNFIALFPLLPLAASEQ
jgi:hypothetical protein